MANPAKRPAGIEAEAYPNNGQQKRQLTSGLASGVSIVRVHDVAEMVDVVKITNAISNQTNENYG